MIALLRRLEGATLDDLTAATGWQAHTARAALTGLKKKGHEIEREKVDSTSRYRITNAGEQ
jgi:DNA-binding transcriptional regulator PaaX